MNTWLCVGGTIMVVIFWLLLLRINGLQNRALVFHTKRGIMYTERGGEGEKSQFLRKVDHNWRNQLLVHLLLIPT